MELPRPRREERFPHRAAALLRVYGREYRVTTRDLSCNGVAVTTPLAAAFQPGAEGALWLAQTGWIPCRVVRRDHQLLGIALHADMAARHSLIRLLFSDPAHNIARQGQPRLAISRFMRRTLLGYGRRRADVAPGCPERFDRAFILWVWDYPHRSRPKTLRLLEAASKPVVTLRSLAAVERWVAHGMPLEGSG